MTHSFVGFKHRDQRQQPQAGRIAVYAVWVDQSFTQHLQTAANTQHRSALLCMQCNRSIQALHTQPGQVAAGVFGAGQDDPITGLQTDQVRRAAYPLQAQTRNFF